MEIEYQQALRYDQGRFSIRFPMVVAPRYIPGSGDLGGFGGGWARDTDQVPDASRITPPLWEPGAERANRVAMEIRLAPGFPLALLESPHHAIERLGDEGGVHRIRLRESVLANRDFVLNWAPRAGDEPHGALFSEHWKGEEYALLMVMPPHVGAVRDPVPREMILVVDTSGSMHGGSIEQARGALRLALGRLTPADRFNVVEFNSHARVLFPSAVAASRDNLSRALAYVDGLEADGGTEMAPALAAALDGRRETPLLRQVVFMTDGSVGNEEALFELIRQRLGASRLFTVAGWILKRATGGGA